MKITVIIVAGGNGSRMGSILPKQFIELNGIPILMHTIRRFHDYAPEAEIRIVLPKDQIDYWQKLIRKHSFQIEHRIFNGGKTRFHSVLNALKDIEEDSVVAIHDGVRPFVNKATLHNCFTKVKVSPSVIPVVDVFETLRELRGNASVTVARERYKLVQTPQVFQAKVLLDAYSQPYAENFTDDASVVESLGHEVTLVQGNRENIKITTPEDLLIAEHFLKSNTGLQK